MSEVLLAWKERDSRAFHAALFDIRDTQASHEKVLWIGSMTLPYLIPNVVKCRNGHLSSSHKMKNKPFVVVFTEHLWTLRRAVMKVASTPFCRWVYFDRRLEIGEREIPYVDWWPRVDWTFDVVTAAGKKRERVEETPAHHESEEDEEDDDDAASE